MKKEKTNPKLKPLIILAIVLSVLLIGACGYIIYDACNDKTKEKPQDVVDNISDFDKIEDFYGYKELKDLFAFKVREKENDCVPVSDTTIFSTKEIEQYNLEDIYETSLQICIENGKAVAKKDNETIITYNVLENIKSIAYEPQAYSAIQWFFFLLENGELYGWKSYNPIFSNATKDDFAKMSVGVVKLVHFYDNYITNDYTFHQVLAYKKDGKPYEVNGGFQNVEGSFSIEEEEFDYRTDPIIMEFVDGLSIRLDQTISLPNEDKLPIKFKTFLIAKNNLINYDAENECYTQNSDGNASAEYYVISQDKELYKIVNLEITKVNSKKIKTYEFIGSGGEIIQTGCQIGEEYGIAIKESGSMKITYEDGTTETIDGINYRI